MTTTRIIIILFALLAVVRSQACECPEYGLQELDNKSRGWSDVIVIADVIETGPNYKMKVVEVLKGSVEVEILKGTTVDENNQVSSCVYFPETKGRYLMYLNKIDKKGQSFYEYSQCSGTRSLDLRTRPIALYSDKSNEELIDETVKWIEYLREKR